MVRYNYDIVWRIGQMDDMKIGYGRLVRYNYDRVEWYGRLDR